MENLKNAIKLLGRNDYMASINLKDAYFLIAISDSYNKFLKFSFEGKYFQFNCHPFGLSLAPYVFTKIMKLVVEYLRSHRIKSVIYLDDFLLIARMKEECSYNVNIATNLLLSIGFILNIEKRKLIQNPRCTFLGFVIDSSNYSVFLTEIEKNILKL